MNRRGGVLPLALFLTIACVFLAAFFAELAAVGLARQRAVTACDFALLSAMRVRREGMETIASRWSLFGGGVSAPGGALTVDPATWPAFSAAADTLRRSVSGFQGRITSALTVALDANGFPRSAARTTTGTGLRLGISAQSAVVRVGAASGTLPGAWYARSWSPAVRSPALTDDARLSLEWPLAWRGASATLSVASAAALEWDADGANPEVAAKGLGGFARSLPETIDGSLFTPHRFPVFRAARARES